MRKKLTIALICAGLGLLAAAPVIIIAHHAFGGEFDPSRPVLAERWRRPVGAEEARTRAWRVLRTPLNSQLSTLRRISFGLESSYADGQHGDEFVCFLEQPLSKILFPDGLGGCDSQPVLG